MKVVVAGGSFGRFYARGIRLAPELELAGILGRGGPQSTATAEEFGVPLYGSVAEVPAEVRIACVVVRSGVVGGRGTELAQEFLARGVHVLQEQPVHQDELTACLKLARANKVQYQLNAFYPHVEPIARFLAAAARLRAAQEPVFLDAACSVQVSYPMVELLGRTLGTLRPWAWEALPQPGAELRALTRQDPPFRLAQGVLGGVPVTLRVQNQINPDDPDNHGHFLHRIALGMPGGVLTLADTHGPVVWTPRLHADRDAHGALELAGPRLALPTGTLLGPVSPGSYQDVFNQTWPAAAAAAVRELAAAIEADRDPLRHGQFTLGAVRAWQDLTGRLGQPDLVRGQDPDPVTAHEQLGCTT
ncbi:Gfo/Idh/MocA family oxidoreductase [Crossiella sp. SN42]|uniref:Gfo/Idh/MocA family oxidoreductase n=1 Tax=Crossiella sp. SN42 TaxID=2944808 RepID=UPI00207D3B98|nr:Gfo/Idh/MocA family oxidoreductase [Crossiella sp. SN42]MCO1578858.1 Gfo/Idh/MocA family oxidoreductase [Crossiella sp. SN42]